jgi:hypothetical protein
MHSVRFIEKKWLHGLRWFRPVGSLPTGIYVALYTLALSPVVGGGGEGEGQQTKEIFFQLFFIVCTHSFQKTQQKHQGNLIIFYGMSKTIDIATIMCMLAGNYVHLDKNANNVCFRRK